MVACVFLGISSGIFWMTEGAIILAYPEKAKVCATAPSKKLRRRN